MSREFAVCVKETISAPPGFVLSWTSVVMNFYPWFLRLGLLLHRLMQ
ncbi:MAG TPA: hypothetical protein VMZ26_02610 [Pyrinomonadaceae bacterium]|nr:hypothetical protein [Pyrinomonadaceae bacterium]